MSDMRWEDLSKSFKARINKNVYSINQTETHLIRNGIWYPIHQDQEGKHYIITSKKIEYFKIEKI